MSNPEASNRNKTDLQKQLDRISHDLTERGLIVAAITASNPSTGNQQII